jgi:transposase
MIVHPADIQDRDGAPSLLARVRSSFPWLRHVFADGGYAGEKLQGALENLGDWTIEIVKRSDVAKGFVLLPRPPPSQGQAVGWSNAPSPG